MQREVGRLVRSDLVRVTENVAEAVCNEEDEPGRVEVEEEDEERFLKTDLSALKEKPICRDSVANILYCLCCLYCSLRDVSVLVM